MLHFEGADWVIHYSPASTDFVCITFPPLGFTQEATKSFFAQKPLEKLGIAAIGVMSKLDHWLYTEDAAHEEAAICALEELASRYNRVIIIGASMGTHAALRYAKRLKAQAVLAMAPKFSLAPKDGLPVPKHLLEDHFRPWMDGMALAADCVDSVERVYIAYDTKDEIDAAHARKILGSVRNITPITFNNAGHYLPPVVAGTENMNLIVHGLLHLSTTDFVHRLQLIRRRHINMLKINANRAASRHPNLVLRILNKLSRDAVSDRANVASDPEILGKLVFALRASDLALNNCLALVDHRHRPSFVVSYERALCSRSDAYNLFSVHGLVIYYHLKKEILIGSHPSACSSDILPIIIDAGDDTLTPYVIFFGRKLYLNRHNNSYVLSCTSDLSVRLIESLNRHWQHLRFQSSSAKRVYLLASKDGFSSISPSGVITLSHCDLHWEALVLIPTIQGELTTFVVGAEPDASQPEMLFASS